MKIHIAQADWPFNKSKIKLSGSFTHKQVEQHYELYKTDNMKALHSNVCLFAFGTDRKFDGVSKALANVIKHGKATVQQSGDTEGWGLSTKSLDEAKELARATSLRYAKQEQAEESAEKAANNKQAAALAKLPKATLNKTVYFFFDQDYAYRGMDEKFKGTLKVELLVQYSRACLLEDYDTTKRIERELNKKYDSNEFEYSLSEAFSIDKRIVEKLLKKGSVIVCEEIGYEAFSLKSAKDAKALVLKKVLRERYSDE